jgi:hypothetical protein
MRKLAILVFATVVASAYAGADASEKARHRRAASPPKAVQTKATQTKATQTKATQTKATQTKAAPAQPVETPVTPLPVPVDTFRA